jgi:outer membrane protein assembly factor BamB
MRNAPRAAGFTLFFGLLLAGAAGADDWPTFRGDARRSGITRERLGLPLVKVWTCTPVHPPSPAWPEPAAMNYAVMHGPLRQTLSFDRAFHVVADADSVYFGSSTDDSVACLEAATGALRWRFITEGPVRLAPVLSGGKLYAGSDDGCLYALEARRGTLLWKHRAGPGDKRLPGNGRMISLWPVRGGIAVEDGKVYFTAGLFPSQGVFLCALDADTGKPVYTRPLEFAAQGTLLAAGDRLFVPTGRTAYWSCDRLDGSPLVRHGTSDPWKMNLVGGCFALVADGVLATGPSEDGQFHWFKFPGKSPMLRAQGDAVIVQDAVVYLLGRGKLAAYDREAYLVESKTRKDPVPLWSVAAGQAKIMILSGDRIVTGGQDEIAVYDAKEGKPLWRDRIDGKAEGLAVSHGRLFASLDNGQTVCFSPGTAPAVARKVADPVTDKPYSAHPLLARAAEAAVKNAATTKGYCLVLQAGTGQLAWEIARRSDFRVVCREEDPVKVDRMRSDLMKAGVYGPRIVVHQGGFGTLPYPKYFANLVVSEGALTEGAALPAADQVLRVLRPCGGVVDMAVRAGPEARRRLEEWGGGLPDWRVVEGEIPRGTARRGRLPGGGEWSHFYADPGNTACSDDEIRPGPMDLQWFGEPGPAEMVDRHKKGPAPMFVDGRLFVPGFNCVYAVDAYNGFVLWERKIPDSVRVGAFRDSSSMAAADSHLLVAAGDACLVLEARTGEIRMKIPAAGPPAEKAWGYLAAVDGLIVGSVARPGGSLRAMGKPENTIVWGNTQPVVCSTSIFAVDRDSGNRAWEYPARGGVIVNPTIAIGGGRVFFVESRNGKTLESGDGRIRIPDLVGQGARLVALDLKSGAPAWSKDVDLSSLQHVIYMSFARDILLVSGSRYAEVDPAETRGRTRPAQLRRIRYDLFAFDARMGSPRWKATAIPNYDHILTGDHGEQVQHPAIAGDVVYGPGFACSLSTGKPHDGWVWEKSAKCAPLSMSRTCAFSRFGKEKLAHIFDLETGKGSPLILATRPGCWINTIPAGGLILIPESSAGCTCEYPIQTSLALVPADR